jgi:uncharacterized protein (TIGR02600 family)
MAGTMSLLTGGAGTPIVSTNNNRLYASVDELFFKSSNGFSARLPAQASIASPDAARMRFFLTTESRSPEVTPLNQPKLCLWPVPDLTHPMAANPYAAPAGSNRTLTDQTIAYCSTLGSNAYYFTRYDATSSTNDLSARNMVLYDYLRRSMDQALPGFMGSFSASNKWAGGTNSLQADQMCTLLFDYIRSCINLVDSSTFSNTNITTNSFRYAYTTPPVVNSSTNVSMTNGTGQVVPIVIKNPDGNFTRGIGRFPTLRGADLWFIARGANQPPLMCHTNGRPMVFDSTGTTLLSASDGSMTSWTDVIIEFLGLATAKVNPMHPWTAPYSSSTQLVPQLMTNVTISIFGFPISLPVPVFAAVNNYSTSITNPLPNFSQLFPVFNLHGANTSGSCPTCSYPTLDGSSGEYVIMGAPNTYYFSNSAVSFPNPVVLATNTTLTAASGYATISAPGTVSGIVTHPGLPYLTVQAASGSNAGAFSIPNPAYRDTNDNLKPGQTRVEMLYAPDFVNVAPGQSPLKPKLSLSASGLGNFMADSTALAFATNTQMVFAANTNIIQNYWFYDLGLQLGLNAETNTFYNTNRVILSSNTFVLGSVAGSSVGVNVTNVISVGGNTVQQVVINFPSTSFPTPKLPTITKCSAANYPPVSTNDSLPYWLLTFNNNDPVLLTAGSSRLNQNISDDNQTYLVPTEMACSQTNASDPTYPWFMNGLNRITADTIRGVNLHYDDPRMISCLSNIPASFFTPHPLYSNNIPITVNGWTTYVRSAHDLRTGMDPMNGALFGTLFGTNTSASSTSGNSYFYPPPFVNGLGAVAGLNLNTTTNMFGYAPPRGTNNFAPVGHLEQPYTGADCDFTTGFFSVWSSGGDFDNGMGFYSDGPFINKVDEGIAADASPTAVQINPYFSTTFKPSGTQLFSPNRMVPSPLIFGSLPVGFASLSSAANPSSNILGNSWFTLQFSPNPNSPSSSYRDQRAKLAGYNEAGGSITNPVLPDHLLLDFFQMPVVEPYPISDPFSMAGKVNMNYQIVPFTYINRDSALRGVLKSVMISAVDDQWGFDYKLRSTNSYYDKNDNYFNDVTPRVSSACYNTYGTNSGNYYFHYPIHPGNTLQQFLARFSQNDIFRSPSEICSLWLYPAQQPTPANPLALTNALVAWDSANANIKAWWYANPGVGRKSLTGDNIRERPYNYLYPRLTTKYRVQVLQQVSSLRTTSSSWQSWNETRDKIAADQRGSAIIERYIDPNDPSLPDFAGLKDAFGNTLFANDPQLIMDRYYRYRVISSKIFTP